MGDSRTLVGTRLTLTALKGGEDMCVPSNEILLSSTWLLYLRPCAQSHLHPYPTLYLGRTGGTGDGT